MKKKPRLFLYLLPPCLLLTMAVLLAVGWTTLHTLDNLYIDRTRLSLQRQAHLLKEILEPNLRLSDSVAIDRICKSVGHKTATRVTVVLASGKVIGESDEDPAKMDYHNKRPELVKAMEGQVGWANRYSRTLMQQMLYVAIPLEVDGRVQAVLRTATAIDDLGGLKQTVRTKLVLFAVIFVILAMVAAWWMSRRIRLWLDAVRQGAEKFGGDYRARRLLPAGSAEFVALTKSFNRMAARLGDRIDDLVGQRNEYEAVLSSMVEGVIAIDLEERLLSINSAAVKILGVDPGRLVGKSIVEAVRNSNFLKIVASSLEDGEAVSDDVILHLGKEQIINVQCVPLRDFDDHRIGSLVVLNDVTQVRHLFWNQ